MRKVNLSDGSTREVGPLTRRQMKDLKSIGVDARGFHPDDEQFDSAFDAVLLTQFTDEDLATLSFPDTRELFFGIVAETWGAKDEEKNS